MTRLNPLVELGQPLHRVEGAIASLSDDLSEIRCLPAVHRELEEVNRQLGAVLKALEGLREDLGQVPPAPSASGRKRADGKAADSRRGTRSAT